MNVYPRDFFEILNAAVRGQDWVKEFQDHSQACAFLARYYRFRMDAVECRTEGAMCMRDMYTTGVDGDGNLFNTRSKQSKPPFRLTWHYQGDEPGKGMSGATAPPPPNLPPTLPDGATFNFEPGDGSISVNVDKAEDFIAKRYNIKTNAEKRAMVCPPCEEGPYGVCLKCGKPVNTGGANG